MSNANHLPEEAIDVTAEPGVVESARQEALVPCPKTLGQEPLRLSLPAGRLPVELDVAVPVREFRVRDLVDLQVGQVVETQWEHTGDLPLAAGDVQLAWSEFEVLDARLGLRLPRLA